MTDQIGVPRLCQDCSGIIMRKLRLTNVANAFECRKCFYHFVRVQEKTIVAQSQQIMYTKSQQIKYTKSQQIKYTITKSQQIKYTKSQQIKYTKYEQIKYTKYEQIKYTKSQQIKYAKLFVQHRNRLWILRFTSLVASS